MKQKYPLALLIVAMLGAGAAALESNLPEQLPEQLPEAIEIIAENEDFTPVAIQPVPGDPWTIGFGTTVYSDGTPVRPGDTITQKQALRELVSHVSGDEKVFHDSLPGVHLSRDEYDAYLDYMYNFGIGNWLGSSMRKYLLAGDHVAACRVLPAYKKVRGADCSRRENQCGRGQDCRGVWDRQVARYRVCMIANGVDPDPAIRKSAPCPT